MTRQQLLRQTRLDARYFTTIIVVLVFIGITDVISRNFPTDPTFGLDKLLHLMGGFVAPLILSMIWRPAYPLVMIVGGALLVGLFWEYLEHIIPWLNSYTPHSFTSPDTFGDLMFDSMGGFIAGHWYRLWQQISSEQE